MASRAPPASRILFSMPVRHKEFPCRWPSGQPKVHTPGSFIPRTCLLPEGCYFFPEELCGCLLNCLDVFRTFGELGYPWGIRGLPKRQIGDPPLFYPHNRPVRQVEQRERGTSLGSPGQFRTGFCSWVNPAFVPEQGTSQAECTGPWRPVAGRTGREQGPSTCSSLEEGERGNPEGCGRCTVFLKTQG